MIITKLVFLKWHYKNKDWYIERGYSEPKNERKEFLVKTEDLMSGCNVLVDVLCDYCLDVGEITYVQKSFKRYMQGRKDVAKDCCLDCFQIKGSENKDRSKIKTSTQQNYIYDIIGGELNLPVSRYALDIAFPEERFYVEYDGSGHQMNVDMGNYSEEKFQIKEIRRSEDLFKRGWKEIRIVSAKDFLPQKEIIKYMIDAAREWFGLGYTKIEYFIDKNIVSVNGDEYPFMYLKLNKITKNNQKLST